MSKHRFDTNIAELETYFNSVIDWISGVFTDVESEMRGLEWGRLFEAYHTTPYDPAAVSAVSYTHLFGVDIYKKFIKKDASEKQTIMVSNITMFVIIAVVIVGSFCLLYTSGGRV